MDRKKRVMLVGGGIGQLPLANKLTHRGGVILIVVCYHILDEIAALADKVIIHDLFDLEGVLEIARQERIDAVVSDQHDLYIPTVAYVAEHLGLPGNKYEQVLSYCDKNKFRDVCELLGIPVPKHERVTNKEQETMLHFPVIVKPADAQSSVGVSKVTDNNLYREALTKAIDYSRSGTAITEEFFEGQEIVSEGLIYNGVYNNLSFGDRVYFKLPDVFIPSQTIFPSTIPEDVCHRIVGFETKLAKHIRPSFAIVHSEWLWNKESNQLCCVESALRGGGVYISSDLIPLCTELPINELLIDYALGQQIDIAEFLSHKKNRASGYICFYLHKGIISKTEGLEELAKLKGIERLCLEGLKVGTEVQKMTHKGQRYGPILVSSTNRDSLERLISDCQETLRVTVEDSGQYNVGPIWN